MLNRLINRLRQQPDTTPPQQQDTPADRPATTAVPPGLVSLVKSAGISLEKKGLTGTRAAVYLVLDRSYSMHPYYDNGAVQHLADQALGLAVNLDDDGRVPLVFFDTKAYPLTEVTLRRHDGVVAEQHRTHGGVITMGGTRYAVAMEAVISHYTAYRAAGGGDPALVIFQTDGAPQDLADTRLLLAEASEEPLYWSFVGFGPRRVPFLEQLDHLGGRLVDNATYFHAGDTPRRISDTDLYDSLLAGFASWQAEARRKGLL
ncbi:VWA domain-containing protein [Streptomyces sp. NBC_01216]|uniref:VWA domain-containing protein n=1 Tax=Streptomyces sp. NBC_01216 TaxID=2903778 RepID=UPI002E149AA6|nr:VWA domain-containing protein [Streptomyces sp. NBC_01216]